MQAFAGIILGVQILAALGMIGLILVQHARGAAMGAAFGGGPWGSLFGAGGSAYFLSRATAAMATLFFVTTLALAYLGNSRPASVGSVLESAPAAASVPAVPAEPAKGADLIPANK